MSPNSPGRFGEVVNHLPGRRAGAPPDGHDADVRRAARRAAIRRHHPDAGGTAEALMAALAAPAHPPVIVVPTVRGRLRRLTRRTLRRHRRLPPRNLK